VSANSPQAAAWFRFDPSIDFATAMPPEQQPKFNDGGGSAPAAPQPPAAAQPPAPAPPVAA
jgi:hypothetical protein